MSKAGRPKVDTEMVRARLPREMLDRIDAYAATCPDKPNRPEALRRIVEEWIHRDPAPLSEPASIDLDTAVAGLVSQPGTKTFRALARAHGTRPPLTGR